MYILINHVCNPLKQSRKFSFSWVGANVLNEVEIQGKKMQKSCAEEEFSHSGKEKKKKHNNNPKSHAAFWSAAAKENNADTGWTNQKMGKRSK